jgi:hypothetical protein
VLTTNRKVMKIALTKIRQNYLELGWFLKKFGRMTRRRRGSYDGYKKTA